MEHRDTKIRFAKKALKYGGLFLLLFANINSSLTAQARYDLTTVPDLIYNDIDGVILGARSFGEMEGTFYDGPHRIYAGIWLGTNIPQYPVSYFLSYTTPLEGYTTYGNEASVQLESSIRTGYNIQRVSLKKRWQPGFNEFQYQELTLSFEQDILFVEEYRAFPQLWQTNWKSLAGLHYRLSEYTFLGKFDANASVKQNVNGSSNFFTIGTLELKQEVPLNDKFSLRLRSFAGLATNSTAPEYLFGYSFRQPVYWLDNGLSRAKGTIPNMWLNDGLVHISGGANLRGYTEQEFNNLSNNQRILYHSIAALNVEFEFPNLINEALNRTIIGDFVHLRSYTFFDAGQSFEKEITVTFNQVVNPAAVADAGLGLQFSLNIPDYLGKDRGFAIRYEMPLWLSDPISGEPNFKIRHLVGIGAVVSL